MINRENIFKLYIQWVDKVSEDLDWKTSFSPKEIVYKICDIIEKEALVGQTLDSAKENLKNTE